MAFGLSSQARNILARKHPDRERLWLEWIEAGARRGELPEIPDVDLLTWASTLSERELRGFQGMGRKLAAEVHGLCDPWPGLVEVQ